MDDTFLALCETSERARGLCAHTRNCAIAQTGCAHAQAGCARAHADCARAHANCQYAHAACVLAAMVLRGARQPEPTHRAGRQNRRFTRCIPYAVCAQGDVSQRRQPTRAHVSRGSTKSRSCARGSRFRVGEIAHARRIDECALLRRHWARVVRSCAQRVLHARHRLLRARPDRGTAAPRSHAARPPCAQPERRACRPGPPGPGLCAVPPSCDDRAPPSEQCCAAGAGRRAPRKAGPARTRRSAVCRDEARASRVTTGTQAARCDSTVHRPDRPGPGALGRQSVSTPASS
jgi:hypothetical protein